MKRALITGITGQDGSHLADLLLSKGYEVHGIVRRSATPRTDNIWHILDRIQIHYGEITDSNFITNLVNKLQPDEIYNLGAQSHVHYSFASPRATAEATGIAPLYLLEAIRENQMAGNKLIKFYQASSSEMFGKVQEIPQKETTLLWPRSPYGCAKVYAHYLTINYRESYNLFACSGILFNHEGERRGTDFVTRKISLAVAKIKLGLQHELVLGNIAAKRDWGYAGDYVEGMWRMLQHEVPGDYILATGETHSIKEFLEIAFARVGLNWEDYVKTDAQFIRPAEVDQLLGDSTKAKEILGWTPRISFVELVHLMVDADLKELKRRV
jgi:GDPmannose 4,6-dehydratase